jgi:methylisocitrate lyase
MKRELTAGKRFRKALAAEQPLQIPGVINAYCAILAEKSGFKALYLSGAGVANASYGVPDVGLTMLDDVLIDARRITAATSLPLLVDADTGWDDPARTARELIKAGAAAMHLEDQVDSKRCGHLPGKKLVSADAMAQRIKAAIHGRARNDFLIMARTDAVAREGLEVGIKRAVTYREAGADLIFAEALTDLSQYRRFVQAVGVPVLANITEFGKTPLFTVGQLKQAGAAMALYPLSAFRAMNAAALQVYRAVRHAGTQKKLLGRMQTRSDLYDFLDYDPAATRAWRRRDSI